MTDPIRPRIFKGTRDFLPAEMIVRNKVISALRSVFELYGFVPMETPCIEYLDILTGKTGSEEDKLIYSLAYKDGRTLGLRYDLTVPLSRVMAMHGPSLPMPFKRYQIQPVWRADKPQKGRYREFWQCDIDTVGSAEIAADAEIILLIVRAMKTLGFKGFHIVLNNRKIITGIMEVLDVPEAVRVEVSKALDKLEKIGRDDVAALLTGEGIAISEEKASRLLDVVTPTGDRTRDLDRMGEYLASSPTGLEGVQELRSILSLMGDVAEDDRCLFSPDMVRGLDYYTGPIFELKVTEPKIGSLGGGGRYDNLIGVLGGGAGYPAVGFAFGFERIVYALTRAREAEEGARGADCLVTVFSPELLADSVRLADELRDAGLRVELYVDRAKKLGRQFKCADRKNIPVTAVCGPDESAKGEVKLKNMNSGEQVTVRRAEAAARIREML